MGVRAKQKWSIGRSFTSNYITITMCDVRPLNTADMFHNPFLDGCNSSYHGKDSLYDMICSRLSYTGGRSVNIY